MAVYGILSRAALVASVLTALLTAACGSTAAGSSGGSATTSPPSSTPPPAPTPPSARLIGSGATFAPPDSVFYMSTPGGGRAWDRLSAIRTALPHDYTQLGSSHSQLGVLAGQLLAPIPGQPHGFGEEAAMTMVSGPASTYGSPDLLFYDPVNDRTAVVRWIDHQQHVTPGRPEGAYVVYLDAAKGDNGAWAISNHVALWASTEHEVREAVQRAEHGAPSLATDTGFRSAMARVDATGAAIVGFSRDNLMTEISQASFITNSDFKRGDRLSQLFGLQNLGFTVGATAGGAVLRGFPGAGVYTPASPYHPALPKVMAADTQAFADTSDAAALLPAVRAVGQAFGNPHIADDLLRRESGQAATRLGPLLHGEQAIWIGPSTIGVGIRADDPDAAESTLRDIAASRQHLSSRHEAVHRVGSIIWMETDTNPSGGGERSQFSQLAARAGLPSQVSLLAYLDTNLFAGFSDTAQPTPNATRALLWTLPRPAGWEFDLYIEAAAQ